MAMTKRDSYRNAFKEIERIVDMVSAMEQDAEEIMELYNEKYDEMSAEERDEWFFKYKTIRHFLDMI